VARRERWSFGGSPIEVCTGMPYLGIWLSSNGNFRKTQHQLSEKGNKALFQMLKNINKFVDPKPNFQLYLFDKLVLPALHYGSEIWGFNIAPDIEKIHIRFCKRLLGVRVTTQNDFVYSKLGRQPLLYFRIITIMKYWVKIVHGTKTKYVNACYQLSLNESSGTGNSWTKSVKDVLYMYGYGDVWLNQGVGDVDIFIESFKLRIKDTFTQNWHSRLEESPRAIFYRLYKIDFSPSLYLDHIYNKSYRIALSRLITSSHNLRVETGRWQHNPPLPRERRLCFFCRNKLEDEYHFVMECPLYNELRKQLIPGYYIRRPSMFKFLNLLQTENKKLLNAVAKFVFKSFITRRNFIANS
jgi:hypothetical protein